MATAPLAAAWGRVWNLPGPLMGAAQAGWPLLPGTLDPSARLIVEAAWGADLAADDATWPWSDITGDVLLDPGISINPIGSQDETSTAPAAGATLQLLNTSGQYSPYNALSPLYPTVRRNTPVRITVDPSTGPMVRMQGYAAGFTPGWDITGTRAVVTVAIGGLTRRFGQGTSPLRSPLFRAISSASPAPVAYWPIEDAANSTQVASGLVGGQPMSPVGTVSFASVTGPDGSAPLADFTNAGQVTAALPVYSSSSWRVEFALKVNTLTSGNFAAALQMLTNGAISLWEIDITDQANGGIYLQWIKNGTPGAVYSNVKVDDGAWHWVRFDAETSGSDIAWFLWVDGNTVANGLLTGVAISPISQVIVDPTGATQEAVSGLGHLVIWAPFTASVDTRAAFKGYAGETTAARMQRLSAEENIPVTVVGSTTTTMGPQSVDTLMALARECETTECGRLYDGLGPGWTFMTRSAMYNQPVALTLDVAAGELMGIDPVDDDALTRNLATVARKSGSSASWEDSTGPLGRQTVGTYDTSITVNAYDDSPLLIRASWEVRRGTVVGLRYPTLRLNLAATPARAAAWLAVAPGMRVNIVNVSSVARQHPPGTVDLLVLGWSEQITQFGWTATLTCAPYAPYVMLSPNSSSNGRLGDNGDSTLALGVGTTDATFSVNTPSTLWSTNPADYPSTAYIDGELVTVTAVTGAASPQAFSVTRSTNGVVRSHIAGTVISVYGTGGLAP